MRLTNIVFTLWVIGCVPVCSVNRPIIGVLVQEVTLWEPYNAKYKSYIAASYVKAVEASGGRVVPVFIGKDDQYYKKMTSKVNGILYPGGTSNISSNNGYAKSGKTVYEIVTKMNANGDSVPILGIGLGMELLLNLEAAGTDLRTPCSAKNEALNLVFQPGFRNSSLFGEASEKDIQTLSEIMSTSNDHRYCVNHEILTLKNQTRWNILTTSTSKIGDVFISSLELKTQPVVLIIFHPERNAYEWDPKQANPHDSKSISAARIFYDWLLSQSRLNNHKFENREEEENLLIYNYNPVYTGKENLYDTQDYFFN